MTTARITQILMSADSKIEDAKNEERLLLTHFEKMLSNVKVATESQDNVFEMKRIDLLEKFHECLKTYLVLFTDKHILKTRIQIDTLNTVCRETKELSIDMTEVSNRDTLRNSDLQKEEIRYCELNKSTASVDSETKDFDGTKDTLSIVDQNQSASSGIEFPSTSFESVGDVSEILATYSPESCHENGVSTTGMLDSHYDISRQTTNKVESTHWNVIPDHNTSKLTNKDTIPAEDSIESIHGNVIPADCTLKSTNDNTISTVDSTDEITIYPADIIESTHGNAIPADGTFELYYQKAQSSTDILKSVHESVIPPANTFDSTIENASPAAGTIDLTNDVEPGTDELKSNFEIATLPNSTLKSFHESLKPVNCALEYTDENTIQTTEKIDSIKENQAPDILEYSTDSLMHDIAGMRTIDLKLDTLQTFKDTLRKSEVLLHITIGSDLKTSARNIISKYRQYVIDLEQFKAEVKESSKTWRFLQTCIERLKDALKVLRFCNANTFLLIGCSGNGKSSTGNSIMQKASFRINSTSSHALSILAKSNAIVDGELIEVIDGPSIDASHSSEDILKHSSRNVIEALTLCDFSFSGLLLVFQYGSRYTKQESLTVKLLKGLLGEKIIADCGICVFTHGDMFEFDMKNEGSHCSFVDWCKQQGGQIMCLFQECNYRCVLFDNKTKDKNKLKEQVDRLLVLRHELKFYSKFDYEHNNQKRELFELEAARPEIRKEIDRKVLEVRTKLQGLELKPDMSVDEKVGDLNILLTELDSFQTSIPTSGDSYFQLVTSLSLEITSKIQLLKLDKDLETSKFVTEKENEKKTVSVTNATSTVKQKLQKLFHIRK